MQLLLCTFMTIQTEREMYITEDKIEKRLMSKATNKAYIYFDDFEKIQSGYNQVVYIWRKGAGQVQRSKTKRRNF